MKLKLRAVLTLALKFWDDLSRGGGGGEGCKTVTLRADNIQHVMQYDATIVFQIIVIWVTVNILCSHTFVIVYLFHLTFSSIKSIL